MFLHSSDAFCICLTTLLLICILLLFILNSKRTKPYICCCLQPLRGMFFVLFCLVVLNCFVFSLLYFIFWLVFFLVLSFVLFSDFVFSLSHLVLQILAYMYLPFSKQFGNISTAFLNTFLHSTSYTAAMITKVPNRIFFPQWDGVSESLARQRYRTLTR